MGGREADTDAGSDAGSDADADADADAEEGARVSEGEEMKEEAKEDGPRMGVVQAVGVTFEDAFGRSRQASIARLRRGDAVRVVWEANNAYDSNAVALVDPAGCRARGCAPRVPVAGVG